LSRSQRISTFVQELRLSSMRTLNTYSSSFEKLPMDILLRIVDLLPRLRLLHLANPRLVSASTPSDSIEPTRTLRELKFETSSIEADLRELTVLLTAFRRISTFTCSGIVALQVMNPPNPTSLRVEINTLQLFSESRSSYLLASWIPNYLQLASLRTLTVPEDLNYALDILIQRAVNLDKLVCYLHTFQPNAYAWPPLRILEIRGHHESLAGPNTVVWNKLMAVVAQINTSRLQELCLSLTFTFGVEPNAAISSGYGACIALLDWSPLCALAMRCRSLTKLRLELHVRFCPWDDAPEYCSRLLREAAYQKLPSRATAILEVVCP